MDDPIKDPATTEPPTPEPEPQPEPKSASDPTPVNPEEDPAIQALIRRKARSLARRWIKSRKSTSEPVPDPVPIIEPKTQAAAPRRVWERYKRHAS